MRRSEIRTEEETMAEAAVGTTVGKAGKRKSGGKQRANGFRLAALITVMLLCLMVYLPLRQQRLNTALVDVIVQENDLARVHTLLESGADPNIRQIFSSPNSGLSNPLEIIRALFHRRDQDRTNSSRTALMIAAAGPKNEIAGDLIAHGANVNAQLKSGTTALLLASSQPGSEMSRLLLEHGANWHVEDRNGFTPLLLASTRGSLDITRALLDKGADVHIQNKKGRTPLVAAVEAQRAENVRLLLSRGATVKDVTGVMPSPLAWAAKNGSAELLKLLWDDNAARRPTDPECGMALLSAIEARGPEAVKFLLEKGVPVNPTGSQQRSAQSIGGGGVIPAGGFSNVITVTTLTPNGVRISTTSTLPGTVKAGKMPARPYQFVWPPLVMAAGVGEVEVVKMLLDRGANVNATDPQGVTPLMRAAIYTAAVQVGLVPKSMPSTAGSIPVSIQIAELLRKHGANINAPDAAGNTVLSYACQSQNAAMLAWLVHQGMSVNIHLPSTQTPLMHVVGQIDTASTRILLDAGADPNATDANGVTALMLTQSADVARLLLDRGANINARDKTGSTALIYSARNTNQELIKLLIQRHANLNLQDKQGHTALSEARARNFPPVIDLLTQSDTE